MQRKLGGRFTGTMTKQGSGMKALCHAVEGDACSLAAFLELFGFGQSFKGGCRGAELQKLFRF